MPQRPFCNGLNSPLLPSPAPQSQKPPQQLFQVWVKLYSCTGDSRRSNTPIFFNAPVRLYKFMQVRHENFAVCTPATRGLACKNGQRACKNGRKALGMFGVQQGTLIAGPAQPPPMVVVAQRVHAAPQQPQPDSSHRLNHKSLHITQAALGVDEVSNEAVLAMARTKGELLEFSIGDEIHPTPADPQRPRHKHFYLKYRNSIQHRDARFCMLFDVHGFNGRALHPHIQGVGPKKLDRANVIYYTQKDKLYIASDHLMNFNQEANSAGWAIEMNQVDTVHDGMRQLQLRHPQISPSQ